MQEFSPNRLSAHSAGYVYAELSGVPMHVGALQIYDGLLSFEDMVADGEWRTDVTRTARGRLARYPLNLAHPVWVNHTSYDFRSHMKRIVLPAPGSDEQLRELASQLFSRPLDLSRPLGEIYLIEGLQNDRCAVLSKYHHCAIDGATASSGLMQVGLAPDAEPPPPEPAPQFPDPQPSWRMFVSGLRRFIEDQWMLLRAVGRSLLHPVKTGATWWGIIRALRKTSPWLLKGAPTSPFAGKLSTERQFQLSLIPFQGVREIRAALGGTVNDVILTIFTGALRRCLERRNWNMDKELLALIPVDVRAADEQDVINRVSGMVSGLPTSINDPVERLRAVSERVEFLKEQDQAGAFDHFAHALAYLPAPLHAFGGGMLFNRQPYNLICSSNRGPMSSLYFMGHELLEMYPLVPLSQNVGLGVAVLTYREHLQFTLAADPHIVPDLALFKRFVDESHQELLAAARAQSANAIAPQSTAAVANEDAVGSPAS